MYKKEKKKKKQSSSAYLLHQCCNNYYAEKYLFTSALSCCCLAATVSPVINCNDGFNGGCEQLCNPGPPARCQCSTVGLVPSPTNRRTCVGAFTVLLHRLVVCLFVVVVVMPSLPVLLLLLLTNMIKESY